jgi:hypothetical protein
MPDNEDVEQLRKRVDGFRDLFLEFRDAAILEIAQLQLETRALRSTISGSPDSAPDDTALLARERELRQKFHLPLVR